MSDSPWRPQLSVSTSSITTKMYSGIPAELFDKHVCHAPDNRALLFDRGDALCNLNLHIRQRRGPSMLSAKHIGHGLEVRELLLVQEDVGVFEVSDGAWPPGKLAASQVRISVIAKFIRRVARQQKFSSSPDLRLVKQNDI